MALVKYYIATTGDAGNDGSIGSPWATILTALADAGVQANAGNDVQIIYSDNVQDDLSGGQVRIFNSITADSLEIIGTGVDVTGFTSTLAAIISTDADLIDRNNFVGNFKLTNIQLQLTLSAGASSDRKAYYMTSMDAGNGYSQADNVYIRLIQNNNTHALSGIVPNDADANNANNIFNNFIIHFEGSGSAARRGVRHENGTVTLKLYNGAVGNATVGYMQMNTAATLKNCVAANCTDSLSTSGGGPTVVTCAETEGSDSGFASFTLANELTDVVNGDYSLVVGGSVLIDGGTDVSAENGGLSTDAEGTARGATWDIGPQEFAAARSITTDAGTYTPGAVMTVTLTGYSETPTVTVNGHSLSASGDSSEVTVTLPAVADFEGGNTFDDTRWNTNITVTATESGGSANATIQITPPDTDGPNSWFGTVTTPSGESVFPVAAAAGDDYHLERLTGTLVTVNTDGSISASTASYSVRSMIWDVSAGQWSAFLTVEFAPAASTGQTGLGTRGKIMRLRR